MTVILHRRNSRKTLNHLDSSIIDDAISKP
jgi:hypothetical protein